MYQRGGVLLRREEQVKMRFEDTHNFEDYERECFTDCTTDDPVSHTRVVLEAAGPSWLCAR